MRVKAYNPVHFPKRTINNTVLENSAFTYLEYYAV